MSDDDLLRTGEISLPKSTSDTAALDLSEVRNEYLKAGIRKPDLGSDPIVQFGKWMKDALAAGGEPTAAALATATRAGKPSVRMVLLKGYDARGFRFFTNYESRKGQELAENPHASLCFFWPQLERQIRIEGAVERASRKESQEYFSSRPYGSQVSAASSPQSRVVADREELESRRRELENEFAGRDLQVPEHWGGYWLWPESIEFWQGRADRLHDRIRFRRPQGSDHWVVERLGP